MTINVIIFSVR